MAHPAIKAAWWVFSGGKPWTTTRSMVGEFGEPITHLFADELAKMFSSEVGRFNNVQLLQNQDEIIRQIVRKNKVAFKHRKAIQDGLRKEIKKRTSRATRREREKAGVR